MQDERRKNFEKISHYADSPLDSISPSLYIQRPWNARASIGLMESLDRERFLRWQRKPLQRRPRPPQLRRLLRRLRRRNSLRTIACAASGSVAHHSPPLFLVSSMRRISQPLSLQPLMFLSKSWVVVGIQWGYCWIWCRISRDSSEYE